MRRIGLIHCALALQALIFLVQELLTMRTMGIPESHISLVVRVDQHGGEPVLARPVGWRQMARRFAIVWYMFLSLHRHPGHCLAVLLPCRR